MKHEAPQFPLPLPQATQAPAPLVLEQQTTREATPARDLQPDLLQAPPQPPAQDLAQWLSRQPAAARRRIAARRMFNPFDS